MPIAAPEIFYTSLTENRHARKNLPITGKIRWQIGFSGKYDGFAGGRVKFAGEVLTLSSGTLELDELYFSNRSEIQILALTETFGLCDLL